MGRLSVGGPKMSSMPGGGGCLDSRSVLGGSFSGSSPVSGWVSALGVPFGCGGDVEILLGDARRLHFGKRNGLGPALVFGSRGRGPSPPLGLVETEMISVWRARAVGAADVAVVRSGGP